VFQEKKRAKEEKLKAEEKYMWALVDGVKEKVDKSVFLFVVLTFLIYDASACVLYLWCYTWEMCSFMELR